MRGAAQARHPRRHPGRGCSTASDSRLASVPAPLPGAGPEHRCRALLLFCYIFIDLLLMLLLMVPPQPLALPQQQQQQEGTEGGGAHASPAAPPPPIAEEQLYSWLRLLRAPCHGSGIAQWARAATLILRWWALITLLWSACCLLWIWER